MQIYQYDSPVLDSYTSFKVKSIMTCLVYKPLSDSNNSYHWDWVHLQLVVEHARCYHILAPLLHSSNWKMISKLERCCTATIVKWCKSWGDKLKTSLPSSSRVFYAAYDKGVKTWHTFCYIILHTASAERVGQGSPTECCEHGPGCKRAMVGTEWVRNTNLTLYMGFISGREDCLGSERVFTNGDHCMLNE